jgi:hypothetical protein
VALQVQQRIIALGEEGVFLAQAQVQGGEALDATGQAGKVHGAATVPVSGEGSKIAAQAGVAVGRQEAVAM